MRSPSLKQQAIPLVLLAILLVVAVFTTAAHDRLKQARRAFSIEYYERLMHRIDVAIESISDTMIEEGMATDFDDLLNRRSEFPVGGDVLTGARDERIPLTLTGIIWHERLPLACINDQLVGVGDSIGDAKLVDLQRLQVVVRYGSGDEQTLYFEEESE